MSRRARLVVPLILVIVIAVVAVSLARGGDDDGSKSGTSPDATSSPTDPNDLLAPQPSPEAEARKNRVIARIQRAALKEAPDVAGPIISGSQSDGRITAAEAEALRRATRALARGKSPYELADTVDLNDPGIRAVARKSLAAIIRRARALAKPIVGRALDSGRITRSQAAEIREFVAAGAGYALP